MSCDALTANTQMVSFAHNFSIAFLAQDVPF